MRRTLRKVVEIKTYLIAGLFIVSSLVTPALRLQSYQNIQSYGAISYPSRLLYGVCSHPWMLTERDFQEMKILGVKYLRMDFIWQDFEPSTDAPFRFSDYEQFIEWAKANNLQIVANLLQVPPWLRPDSGGMYTIPTGADFDNFVTQFGQFVYAVVDHYKGDITYFEVWNEPNNYGSWNDTEGTILEGTQYNRGKAITKYVTLLKEAYAQAKVANPNCKIISGGLSENDHDYVQGMYNNGVKGYFDYLGLHPYFYRNNFDPDYVDWNWWEFDYFPKIELVRNVMVANGDGYKDIFVTELGFNVDHTTEENAAVRLKRVFEKIDHDPGYPYVNAVMWYEFREYSNGYGLLHEDYTPRQLYYAYKDIISPH